MKKPSSPPPLLPSSLLLRKRLRRRLAALLAPALLAAAGGWLPPLAAQTITEIYTVSPNAAIPDNSTVGLLSTQSISSNLLTVTDVQVRLTLTGTPGATNAFNGDFYAYLVHPTADPLVTGFAVLLNRVGRASTAGGDFGYSDSGFNNVRFSDAAPAGDIHTYRASPGGFTLDANGALTGTWQPDGRSANPNVAVTASPRDTTLGSFTPLNPNGQWSLFLSDNSPVGTGLLATWTLEITGVPVPEPGTTTLLLLGASGGAAALGAAARRRRKQCSPSAPAIH